MSLQNDNIEAVQKPKNKKLKKVLIIIGIVLLCLIIITASAYAIMYNIGKKQLLATSSNQNTGSAFEEYGDDTILHKDTVYKYNENLTSVLFMGVDERSIKTATDDYGTNGQADALYLAVIDTLSGKTDIIGISRDTMTDVAVYSKQGKYIGTEQMQLCLAYAYGDRRHSSCENVVQSVSRMLNGIPINTYFAMDLSGIKPLVDSIGGVTVNTYDQNGIKNGTQKLNGESARKFIQTRDKTVLDSNIKRMDNQQEFINAFISTATQKTKKDLSVPVQLYNVVANYSVTNINASKITYLASRYISGNASVKMHTLQGQVVQGNYAEYYLDEEKLLELILDVFYIEQK